MMVKDPVMLYTAIPNQIELLYHDPSCFKHSFHLYQTAAKTQHTRSNGLLEK